MSASSLNFVPLALILRSARSAHLEGRGLESYPRRATPPHPSFETALLAPPQDEGLEAETW